MRCGGGKLIYALAFLRIIIHYTSVIWCTFKRVMRDMYGIQLHDILYKCTMIKTANNDYLHMTSCVSSTRHISGFLS